MKIPSNCLSFQLTTVYARFILTMCFWKMFTLFFVKDHWIWLIYALLSQSFVVRIYALFPQIFLAWKTESVNFFAFWMYVSWETLQHSNSSFFFINWDPNVLHPALFFSGGIGHWSFGCLSRISSRRKRTKIRKAETLQEEMWRTNLSKHRTAGRSSNAMEYTIISTFLHTLL